MPSLFAQSELSDLFAKVEKGERLDFEAGLRMMKSKDILALGFMANYVRERKNGNRTLFIVSSSDTPNPLEATLVYGNQESLEERIEWLLKIRTQQDTQRQYLSFSPYPLYAKNANREGTVGVEPTTGFEDLKMLATSRILLDNIEHITTSWMILGPKLAQVSLAFGVDDLSSSEAITKRAMINMIQKAGRDPGERDTLYRVL